MNDEEFVYVTEGGYVHSRDMTREQLLAVIKDLIQERDSLRAALREEQSGFLSFLRRRK